MLKKLFFAMLFVSASARPCSKCTEMCSYRDGLQPCGNECCDRGDSPTAMYENQGEKPNCACYSHNKSPHWKCCTWCSDKSKACGDRCIPKKNNCQWEETETTGCACNSRDYEDE
jgi:hypothetical protein